MRGIVAYTVLVLVLCSAAWGADVPVTVSPGDASRLALIGDACPTFSWGGVEGARSYDVVVYRVGDESEAAQPVLRQRISGSALSWTPALDFCLARGGRYAWSVRAQNRKGDSNWSPPSLFEVTAGPSEAEFEAALQVVEKYLTRQQSSGPLTSAVLPLDPGTHPSVKQRTGTAAGPASASVPFVSGRSAIQAQIEAAPNETTFGVVGLTSAAGANSAGVYGEDTAGFPFSYGVWGVSHNDDNAAGVFGFNNSPDTSHGQGPGRLHSFGAMGLTDHVDGIGVIGFGLEARGTGVVGVGHVGVRGFTCSPDGGFGGGSCNAVYEDDGGTAGYGGFFANPDGDLIGAHATGDLANPHFRVDNSGKVFATAFDMSALDVTTVQQGSTSATCPTGSLRTGGGCNCNLETIRFSAPSGNDEWTCQCESGGPPTTFVVCLESS